MYQTNPSIEAEWIELKQWLARLEGIQVAQRMNSLHENNREIWNPLYWRINAWLCGWFSRHPLTPDEEDLDIPRFQIGTMRFNAWWSGIKDPEHGACPARSIEDLPFMSQEMRKIGEYNQKDRRPSPPPYFDAKGSSRKEAPLPPPPPPELTTGELGGNAWK